MHLVGYFHRSITMHGFIKVKYWNLCSVPCLCYFLTMHYASSVEVSYLFSYFAVSNHYCLYCNAKSTKNTTATVCFVVHYNSCTASHGVQNVVFITAVLCFGYWYILLTAVGLPPGGSSTIHIYTQTVYRTTQWNRKHRTEPTLQ